MGVTTGDWSREPVTDDGGTMGWMIGNCCCVDPIGTDVTTATSSIESDDGTRGVTTGAWSWDPAEDATGGIMGVTTGSLLAPSVLSTDGSFDGTTIGTSYCSCPLGNDDTIATSSIATEGGNLGDTKGSRVNWSSLSDGIPVGDMIGILLASSVLLSSGGLLDGMTTGTSYCSCPLGNDDTIATSSIASEGGNLGDTNGSRVTWSRLPDGKHVGEMTGSLFASSVLSTDGSFDGTTTGTL